MKKSLGSFRIEKSSSANPGNIKWTQKVTNDSKKPRKKPVKKDQKSSSTNIVYTDKVAEKKAGKNFKIEDNTQKVSKGESVGKKFQKSSASNCKIKQGFRRPGR